MSEEDKEFLDRAALQAMEALIRAGRILGPQLARDAYKQAEEMLLRRKSHQPAAPSRSSR